MLAIIAVVLIAFWLLGFLAFHVGGSFVHLLLVASLVMFVLHFLRQRGAIA